MSTAALRLAAPGPASARQAFVARVADAFETAGVEYVVLHGADAAHPRDSDVDVAVGRTSLTTVDAVIRSGAFGRLVQCLHYDVPWCRYYVVRADEPGRRYRALDVACDPWGIGRYGNAIHVALATAERPGAVTVPSAAGLCVYLAAKRSRKPADAAAIEELVIAFALDPDGARELLVRAFGAGGETLAAALTTALVLGRRAGDLPGGLLAVRRASGRKRGTPPALARRAWFSGARLVHRLARPTGVAVTLAGPDGAGKSTLAAGLAETALVAFRRVERLHLGPGVLPAPGRLLRRPERTTTLPHAASPSGPAGSAARLAYLFADACLGWPVRVAWPRLRSGLVLLERGWWDLAVDPRRYRLATPARLTHALGRIGPRPDLVLLLDAPATTIRRRKPELPAEEIERQRLAWQGLSAADPARYRAVDTSRPAPEVLADALELIDEALADRQLALDGSALALRCLGHVRHGGRPHTIVAPGRRPRWVLPTGSGGPVTWGLYRPTSARRVAGAIAVEGACRLRAGYGPKVELDVARGLGPALAEAFGWDAVELAAAIPRDAHRAGRVVLAVRSRGRLVAFAKVEAADPARLWHERAVLGRLASCDLDRLVVPRALAAIEWQGCAVLVLEPLHTPIRSQRDAGDPEVEALAELGRLGDALGPVLGAADGRIPAHGDFAPWNAARNPTGRLALWDWEAARLGLPLEDLFSWRVRALLHLGHGTPEALVAGAQRPDTHVEALAAELGVSADAAPAALRAALDQVGADAGAGAGTRAVVDRATELLGGGV